MAKNCSACNDLRTSAPDFVENGVTDSVCTSLKNNTGFNPSNGNNDCTDLDNANECLINNMQDELPAYDVCDWKEFMKKFIPNTATMFKAMICAICGLFTKVTNLCTRINKATYIGTLTLYTTAKQTGSGSGNQAPAFNSNTRQGNIPTNILSVTSDYKGITVNNTLDVPILVNSTFTCSIDTEQHFASCFIVITKDNFKVGQSPFITPDTYDQSAVAEPFVLNPGQSATMRYYFRVGNANAWFQSQFGYRSGGSGEPKCVLAKNDSSNPENQRSYFSVQVTSIMPEVSC